MIQELFYRAKLLFQSEREFRYALHHILGFWPRDIQPYRTAMSHRSAHTGVNNERLEFLGDAVLDAIIADILYRQLPRKHEGALTQIRSRIVSRESLGRLAHSIGLEPLVNNNLHNTAHNSYMAGNAFEALLGAIYLDYGYARCKEFVERRLMPTLPDIKTLAKQDDNYKSHLLEWCQKRHITLQFDIVQRPDPDPSKSSPIFEATAIMAGQRQGTGHGYSKKQAAQAAAQETLAILKKKGQ